MPGHADEQRTIMAEVGGPPVLGVGHQGGQVSFQGLEVEALERLGIIEVRVGARLVGMLVKNSKVEPGQATSHGWWCRHLRFDGTGISIRSTSAGTFGSVIQISGLCQVFFQPSVWARATPHQVYTGLAKLSRRLGMVLHPGADTPPARGIRGATGKTSRAWAEF